MTDITAPPAKLTRDFGTKADKNYKAILATQAQVSESFLVMGSLLKACRDEKYFTAYGHEKFEHFLGSPELGMSRSMAMGLIQVHELYVLKLDRPTDELTKAGIGKLLAIAPIVESNPDEWLGKAQTMSRSDLKEEVAIATGKEPEAMVALTPDVRPDEPLSDVLPFTDDYVEWVRRQHCIICGKAAEPHHFPVTKGAGGKAVAEHVIPLCRECHTEAHDDPMGWMGTYKEKWGNYFFNVIFMLWPKAPKADAIEMKVVEGTFVADDKGKAFDVEVKEGLAFPKPEKAKKRSRKHGGPGDHTVEVTKYPGIVLTEKPAELAQVHPVPAPLAEELSADADKTAEELLKAEEPKVMEGFGKFSKCYKCGSMQPEAELEGGLCATCKE